MLVKHFNVDVLYEIEKTLNLAATKAPPIHISYKEWRLFRDSVLVSHQPQRKLFFFPHPIIHHSLDNATEIKSPHTEILLMWRCI